MRAPDMPRDAVHQGPTSNVLRLGTEVGELANAPAWAHWTRPGGP
jgi:hypothetical protein